MKGDHDNLLNIREEMNDGYTGIELGIPRGTEGQLIHDATEKCRAVDVDGKTLGITSNNPITDTRLYKVEFIDGSVENVPAHIIAENLLSQVDHQEGHRQLMIDKIINHRSNHQAIQNKDAFYCSPNGRCT